MSKIKLTNQSAPDTPSSGKTEIYVDSSTKIISSKDDSGNVVPYFISDGWIPANQTWTYASSTTITVPSGAASIYSVGDKIKFTQTTAKYFYIVAVADTLLTLTGGTDYTVTNATISSKYYSKMVSPVGFPGKFAYTFTPTSWAGTFTSVTGSGTFIIVGRLISVEVLVHITTNGTAAGYVIAYLPINAAAGPYIILGRENGVTGIILSGYLTSNYINISKLSDGSYVGGNGYDLLVAGDYRIT